MAESLPETHLGTPGLTGSPGWQAPPLQGPLADGRCICAALFSLVALLRASWECWHPGVLCTFSSFTFLDLDETSDLHFLSSQQATRPYVDV